MQNDAKTAEHLIWILGEQTSTTCTEEEPALFALERNGRTGRETVRVGCRQGGCGACRVRVTSGDYTTGRMSRAHVTEEEREQGYALCCRLYPRSDLVLEPAFVGPRRDKTTMKA